MQKLKKVKHEDEYDIFCDKCGCEYDEDMRENGDGDEFIKCPICERDLCSGCYGRTLSIIALDMIHRNEICSDCRKLIDEKSMTAELGKILTDISHEDGDLVSQIRVLEKRREGLRESGWEKRKIVCQRYFDEAKEKFNNNNSNII